MLAVKFGTLDNDTHDRVASRHPGADHAVEFQTVQGVETLDEVFRS